jgi:hypothetical protein
MVLKNFMFKRGREPVLRGGINWNQTVLTVHLASMIPRYEAREESKKGVHGGKRCGKLKLPKSTKGRNTPSMEDRPTRSS